VKSLEGGDGVYSNDSLFMEATHPLCSLEGIGKERASPLLIPTPTKAEMKEGEDGGKRIRLFGKDFFPCYLSLSVITEFHQTPTDVNVSHFNLSSFRSESEVVGRVSENEIGTIGRYDLLFCAIEFTIYNGTIQTREKLLMENKPLISGSTDDNSGKKSEGGTGNSSSSDSTLVWTVVGMTFLLIGTTSVIILMLVGDYKRRKEKRGKEYELR
jgi:hypothetical protein